MAVTSKASATTSFPLRILNTGPSYIRNTPTKEQHLGRKSAMERLAESRTKFVRSGSGEELDDAEGTENRKKQNETAKSHQTSTQDGRGRHVFRAVPYICGDGGDRGPQPAQNTCPGPPAPIPNTPEIPEPKVKGLRKGSRDRTLEIVADSLAFHERQNSSSDDEILNPTKRHLLNSSDSMSPQSPSAGSRVQRLKEQFLAISSAESESDTSQGRKTPADNSGSSHSSSRSWTAGRETDHARMNAFTRSRKPQLNHQPTEQPKKNQGEVAHPVTCASSGDQSQQNEKEFVSETKTHSSAFADPLTDQTRRQIERFKARYATDATKENGQERKISRIVLKPPSQVSEKKERSLTTNEAPRKTSSTLIRERSHTSNMSNDLTVHLLGESHHGKEAFASHIHARHKHSKEKITGDGTSQKILYAKHNEVTRKVGDGEQDMTKPLKSNDLLRQGKQHSVCGQSTKPLSNGDEAKLQAKPSDSRRPVHSVSKRVSQMKLESKNPPLKIGSSSLEVNHRRAKSDLDRSNIERSSVTAEAKPNRRRHLSHDDQLKPELDLPQQVRKVSAPSVFHERVKSNPDTLSNFQKKSWAPVNFNRNQVWGDVDKRMTEQESRAFDRRASSPELQTPGGRATNKNLQKQLFTPEVMYEQAKSTVTNFLSGIMSSPVQREIPGDERTLPDNETNNQSCNQRDLIQDRNGNQIAMEMPTRLRGKKETILATKQPTSNEVNSNVNVLFENQKNPRSSWKARSSDVELILVTNQEDLNRIRPVSKGLPTSVPNELRDVRQQDKTKIHHVDPTEGIPQNEEPEKRRKFSQNSDASSSKHSRHDDLGYNETSLKVEKTRAKKISLADLLSKDNAQGTAEGGLIKATEGKPVGRDETDCKRHRLPSKSDKCHRDDSETDSDEELQRSKVLRVKKTRSENKKADKALQTLLSRIINPEDDLNTLKRGKKISDLKKSEQETAPQPSRDDSAARNLENNPLIKNIAETSTPNKSKAAIESKITRPSLNLNLKTRNTCQAVKELISPPASLASPTRRDILRRRSKSDLGMSPRCSVSSAHSEVDYFFNQMGMNDSFFQGPLSPLHYGDEDEVFNTMHEYKHSRAGSFSTEDSGSISRGSKVSNEGLHLAKKLPDASSSIITKNARVIKWLCQMRKARASSIS